jgi:hypothetical protein
VKALLSTLASSMSSAPPDKDNPLLAPCSRFDARYENLPFKSKNFTDWPKEYNDKVQAIVEEHMNYTMNASCGAGDVNALLAPRSSLQELADKLPTWKGSNKPPLRQSDIGLVLMEFLNMYECALKERFFFLSYDSLELKKQQMSEAGKNDAITYPEITREMENGLALIRRELAVSRKTLTRTLLVIGGMNRLLPLDLDLRCIAGASMDLRNAAALAAEASACLPRVWNAKDPLRDIMQQ